MLKSVLNQILAESDFKVLSDWTTTWGKNVEASLWFLSLVLLQISTPGIKVFLLLGVSHHMLALTGKALYA